MATVDIKSELEKIRKKNGGLLTEESIVSAAKSEKHPLHSRFTWDDTEAAKQWRLEEARKLIRSVYVTIEAPRKSPVLVRAYASLPSDREEGNGYRSIQDVLDDKTLRAELLTAALADLDAFRKRYGNLSELAPVFEAHEKVRTRGRVLKMRRPVKRIA